MIYRSIYLSIFSSSSPSSSIAIGLFTHWGKIRPHLSRLLLLLLLLIILMEASAAAIAPAAAAAALRFSRWLGPHHDNTTPPPPPPLNRRHRSLFFLRHHSGRGTPPKSTTLLSRPSFCLEAANVNVSPLSTPFCSLQRHPLLLFTRHHRRFHVNCIDRSPTKYVNDDAMHIQSDKETQLGSPVGRPGPSGAEEGSFDGGVYPTRPKRFQNRFLNFARLGSVVSDAAEAFFKSEIRRRLFVTAVLILVSRIGYFIPLPGFDRRLIPDNYLSFAAGSVDELGDFTSELKLSLFQLGISPQIAASIIMQVLCHIVPSLVKLRKEGLDGHEKIKSYIWWISLGFAIVEAVIVSCYSLQYSVYAASHRFKHVMVTSFFLVLGAMSMTWICDTISESGFGQGSSLIICAGILTGYTDTLHKMLSQFSGNAVSWWPYVLAVLGIFTVVTMWAVLVTEGCRKIKLQYYAFKLASSSRTGSSPVTEVEPYIPFNINPTGMQPVLTTTYLLAFPSIMASIFASPFWENLKKILNPGTSSGAKPWVFYTIYAFFVFLFNIFDIANLPKEIADYMSKMGARIPNIKPGKLTIEYLTKIQASTRFWGGLLLSILATSSTLLDHYLRRINEGFALGFTSVLIIVGSIIELRRSYQAYNVMPSLSKVLRRYGV